MITQGVDPAPTKPSNIASRSEIVLGDVERGFAEADIIIEREFRTEAAHQGYIEPHACLANVTETASARYGAAPRVTTRCATAAPTSSAWTNRSCG